MAVPKFTTEEIPEVGVEGRREPERAKERLEMVSSQIEARGVRNPRVLEAMRQLERHRFIPADGQALAYRDGPVAIGQGQTISQPYIVACMTEFLKPQPSDHVLEIGTGSGYQTAVLAELVAEVHTGPRRRRSTRSSSPRHRPSHPRCCWINSSPAGE